MADGAWPGAAAFLPAGSRSLPELAAAAAGCQGCPLFTDATQTVFGRGPADARVALVGEQPGDVEDRRGMPFVGPAGHLLVRAVTDAGLAPSQVYVTNTVKHFRHLPAAPGKRRIHQTPEARHVAACRPWLVAELTALRPHVVVLLGATAAQALLGPDFRVTRSRGQLLPAPAGTAAHLLATIHPSAVLRTPEAQRPAAFAGLVADLRVAAAAMPGRS